MKRFKKVIALGLAAMAAVSAMNINVMAKETMQLDSGVVLEMYNSATDEIPDVPTAMDVDDFKFNLRIPVYPDFVYLTSTENVRNLSLDTDQHVIQITFDKMDRFKYFSLYDVTAGRYLAGSSTTMEQPSAFANDVFRFTGLTGGHTYRIAFAHIVEQTNVTGSVISY